MSFFGLYRQYFYFYYFSHKICWQYYPLKNIEKEKNKQTNEQNQKKIEAELPLWPQSTQQQPN